MAYIWVGGRRCVRVIVSNTGHTWGSVNPGYLTQLQILPANKTTRPDVCTSHAYYHCRISEKSGTRPDVITYCRSLWEWRNSIFDVFANWRWRYLCHRTWFNDPSTNKSDDFGFQYSVIVAIESESFKVDRSWTWQVNSSGEDWWVTDLWVYCTTLIISAGHFSRKYKVTRFKIRSLTLFDVKRSTNSFVNILINYYCS